ncbi:MAG: hypothetical protein IKR86_02775 [Candidatus Methanomethylophilaceae archaeon]|nr:hypothetical protein [Candidatus Methanomethylophilaceae archaeon]
MIYTPLTYLAMRIAYEAHHGVMDKNGAPYIFHPYEVASRMDDEVSTAVAFLHDVVEDTDLTFDDLRAKGIPEEVIVPLTYLTHDPEVPYMEYIRHIAENRVATKVKLSDLAHNMDKTRYCRPMTWREAAKRAMYGKAKEYLLDATKD